MALWSVHTGMPAPRLAVLRARTISETPRECLIHRRSSRLNVEWLEIWLIGVREGATS
jgi:hypothetical protein